MTLNDIKQSYSLDIDDSDLLPILRKVPWIAYSASEWTDDYYGVHVNSKDIIQTYLLKIHEYNAVDISRIIKEAESVRRKV